MKVRGEMDITRMILDSRRLFLCASACLALTALSAAGRAAPDSTTNGVYGGYLASSAWFKTMRSSQATGSAGAHHAWQKEIEDGIASGKLVEVMVEVKFPNGNPF